MKKIITFFPTRAAMMLLTTLLLTLTAMTAWAQSQYNLGNCWHEPGAAQPTGTYMRNPIPPYASLDVNIYTGNLAFGDEGENPGDQSGGAIYYRTEGASAWKTAVMEDDTEIGDNKYWRGTIPANEFDAGVTVEYVIEVTYNDSHHPTYLGLAAADDTSSTPFGTLESAAKHPFSFTYANKEPTSVNYIDAAGIEQTVKALPLQGGGATMLSAGWYVVNSDITVGDRINLTGDTNLILGDDYTLNVEGIYIPQGSTLTIFAQSDGMTAGKIVSHPTSGAAIGGKSGKDNGNIVICGGIIEATGGKDAAAIGSADGGDGGNITINGGTITANGPTDSETCENGAGIGGGDGGNGGTITINGGTITTYSRDGAGIGGGDEGDGGNITINGGTITSVKVNQGQGARIGGGCYGAPGTIIINGGTITTDGGTGAGIGGGKRNWGNGTVTINGGVIDAIGSYGIGAGEGGADVAITLGWTNVDDCIKPTSYNGSVTIADGKSFYNGSEVLSSGIVTDMDKLKGKTLQPCVLLTVGADNDYSDRTSGLGSWAGTDMTAAFQRTFNAGKASTICLPFPMTSIEGGKVYEFRNVSWDATYNNNEGGWVATMQDASPTNKVDATTANKPYLFLPDGTSGTVDVTFMGSMDAVASVAAGNDPQGDWTFHGTYSRLGYGTAPFDDPVFGFAANDGSNGVVAGEFVRAISGAYIPAFRAFLKYSGNETSLQARATRSGEAGKPETIIVRLLGKNGEIDGIGEIRLSTGEVTFDSNAWYDLSGRKLNGEPTQKGIYINNGHKIVIK